MSNDPTRKELQDYAYAKARSYGVPASLLMAMIEHGGGDRLTPSCLSDDSATAVTGSRTGNRPGDSCRRCTPGCSPRVARGRTSAQAWPISGPAGNLRIASANSSSRPGFPPESRQVHPPFVVHSTTKYRHPRNPAAPKTPRTASCSAVHSTPAGSGNPSAVRWGPGRWVGVGCGSAMAGMLASEVVSGSRPASGPSKRTPMMPNSKILSSQTGTAAPATSLAKILRAGKRTVVFTKRTCFIVRV